MDPDRPPEAPVVAAASSAASAAPSPAPAGSPASHDPPPAPGSQLAAALRRYRSLVVAIVVLVALVKIVPAALTAWRTVSTDDAYVNGHVTFVAPRVAGPGGARAGGRQQPRPQGRPARAARQGAVSGAGRASPRRPSTRRRPISSPRRRRRAASIGQARSLRFSLEHAIEDVEQPDRAAAVEGGRAANPQKATLDQGAGRLRPRQAARQDRRGLQGGIRPPQGGARGRAGAASRRRCRASTRSASPRPAAQAAERRRSHPGARRSGSDLLLGAPGAGELDPGRVAARRASIRSTRRPGRWSPTSTSATPRATSTASTPRS